ncbi:phenol hydroxylase subunit [Amphritea sp.]|uniref:phenol hydroxylase subunit n=1 Tax=Amphritea sp. TaxID=1872502 RepID=UPI003A8D0795
MVTTQRDDQGGNDCLDSHTGEKLIRYVRVRSPEHARFVEFDFAIGDPALFVELIMPQKVFDQFCQTNNVVFMTQAQQDAVDIEMKKWRYGEATLMARNR